MKAIATICSKHKNEDLALMPARLRYTAPHIQATESIAEKSGLLFYIFSGKFGLISGEEMIPNYDYYLEDSAVDMLAETIAAQLQTHGISELDFYTEAKPSWAPYESAIRKASELAGSKLTIRAF